MRLLDRDFYHRDSREVAPELLGKLMLFEGRGGRIVEVEAYAGSEDPGSHAYRGRTKRNAIMFGPPGFLYVYLIYGMHWCSNVVCLGEGTASAVLIRALAPTHGCEEIRRRRPKAKRDKDLCSGPARLCQGLGIDGRHDGSDVVAGDRGVMLYDDSTPPPEKPGRSTRIGLSAGAELPWRWFVPGDPNLSRPG